MRTAILVLLCISSISAFAEDRADYQEACEGNVGQYDFPIQNPLVATAASLLVNGNGPEPLEGRIQVLPERVNVPLVGERSAFTYSFYPAASEGAPLVVFIAGIGGSPTRGSARFVGQIFSQAGYNVLAVHSPFSWQFSLSASRSGTAGFGPDDAADLYEALKAAMLDVRSRVGQQQLREDAPVSLAGFSLGALAAAHLSALDERLQEGRIGFRSVLLINPPVDLSHGIQALDGFYQKGLGWSGARRDQLRTRAVGIYLQMSEGSSGAALPDVLSQLERGLGLTNDEVGFLIGEEFRKSLGDMIFASQQVKDLGVLRSPATFFRQNDRVAESRKFSYLGYFDLFALRAWEERHRSVGSVDNMLAETGLAALADHIKRRVAAGDMTLLHNCDDFLLRAQDFPLLKGLFGERMRLFPRGGHGGNLWMRKNVEAMIAAIS